MAKYDLAESLKQLRNQVNATWPNRDKGSDGWIGDDSHNARKSDHNPDYSAGGVVRALDIDKDGIDVDVYLAAVVGEPRVHYVIWDEEIWTKSKGWKPYDGPNPHKSHIHVSIHHTEGAEAGYAWNLSKGKPATVPAPVKSKSIGQLADEVIDGKHGSGSDREKALGAKYAAVQAEVNKRLRVPTKAPAKPRAKSIAQLADEVIDGKYGSGDERKRRLGSKYSAVQAEVNKQLGVVAQGKTIRQLAEEVIAGKHGNGEARKKSLGSRHAKVQAEVNRLLR